MAKRLLLIGAIVVTMAALCSNAAWAFRIPGGGLRGFGYYDMWFETVGRGGHIDQGNFAIVNGILDIQLGYNKSLNPGSGMFEISPGEGETVTQGYTTVDLTALERWGRSEDIIRVWNTVPEFAELLFGIYEECSGSTPPAACTDSDNDLYNNYENYEPCDTTLYHDEDTDTWDYVGLYDDCPDALTEWLGVWGGK
jgi:hypothetical protein